MILPTAARISPYVLSMVMTVTGPPVVTTRSQRPPVPSAGCTHMYMYMYMLAGTCETYPYPYSAIVRPWHPLLDELVPLDLVRDTYITSRTCLLSKTARYLRHFSTVTFQNDLWPQTCSFLGERAKDDWRFWCWVGNEVTMRGRNTVEPHVWARTPFNQDIPIRTSHSGQHSRTP